MNDAKRLFAALITRAKSEDLDDVIWLNACGLGPLEDAWDEFQDAFEAIFEVSWKESEEYAERIFDGEKREFVK